MSDRLPFPYRPEAEVVADRLAMLNISLEGAHAPFDWASAARMAKPWVQAVRDNPPPFWAMESLLKEYPISSAEGLALMRLAEALLRVPDAPTAIALTADQLGRADFDGGSDGEHSGMLANLSSAAIALSKKFLPHVEGSGSHEPPNLIARMGAKTVVAATVRAVQLLGRQFVLGQTIADAMHEADGARKKVGAKTTHLRFSYDMLGEGARTDADARCYLASYTNAINSIAYNSISSGDIAENDGISIKLSALHPRYEHTQHARVMEELIPRVWSLCELAAKANINLTIDAEEVDRLELSLDLFEALAERVAQHHPQWCGLGLAMQAYQTRALELIAHVVGLARQYNIRFMCRLVKGAYWDAEIKRTQELGLPAYPVFTHKHHTDVSYLACARAMLAAPDALYSQFATHNASTIAAVLQLAARSDSNGFELQRLHGMGEGVYREVLKNPLIACRVYAPVGAHKDLLAYLVRRLLENGANSSFVNQLADESVGMEELLISPLRLEPVSALPMPVDLYGPSRRNSRGLDLAVQAMREPLLAALATTQVPNVPVYGIKNLDIPVDISIDSYKKWSTTSVTIRANALRQAADALEAELPRFCALLVKEAFKTWGDAVGEVREAVDFLRYYASEAERIMQPMPMPGLSADGSIAYGITGESNVLRLTARGPWVCISPWNFPLAIFMGQVAAALATGNTVLAKPAEQTPAVALEAIKLLHAAGVPEGALQLFHGPGETVGAALVAHPQIAGVVFTGSTQVAKIINRALAAKDGAIVPLIAETGGVNAMVVDSSALPEQVVDAVVQSAFRSAGQRCSALRLLCVHEAIADSVIEMVHGAALELQAGNPGDLATDLGPVIDAEAYEGIQRHVQRLKSSAKLLFFPPLLKKSAVNLVPPTAFEVNRISDMKQEIFGPVLHIVRWGSGDLSDPTSVIEHINALGYGLTLGVHSRIDSRAQALASMAHTGNVYINRNIIGAVVGVQPFGGEGLSGTGPKAGGPHYLYRFCAEKTLTVNTTAAGGNVALMAHRL
jgi:RHH-type transcriptional regulator, proline utilization regulon repressor / proline dehydrogenase / delta 1-pyrroline-5-carboxylate dehydrogenase